MAPRLGESRQSSMGQLELEYAKRMLGQEGRVRDWLFLWILTLVDKPSMP
jgi:hypothetical protein